MEKLKDYDEISIHFIGESFKQPILESDARQHKISAEKVI